MLLQFPPPDRNNAWLLLGLDTKLGTRIPNASLGQQPPETMAVRRDMVLEKHPNAQVRSLSSQYNCVGMVFGARRTVIEPEYVPWILFEDGYHQVPDENDLIVGDVVVYKTDNGEVGHVGIIVCIKTAVNPPRRNITVLSQWGLHGEFFHEIDDVKLEYGNQKEFWTDRI